MFARATTKRLAVGAATNEDGRRTTKHERDCPDAVMVGRIENAAVSFSVQTDDRRALNAAGGSETVIVAIIDAVGSE